MFVKKTRFISFLLLLCLLMSLCACGKEEADDRGSAGQEAQAKEAPLGWTLEYRALPEGLAGTYSQCSDGTNLYLAGVGTDGRPALGRMDEENYTPYQVPEDIEELRICFPAGDGGLGVLGGADEFSWIMEHDRSEPCPTELLLFDGEGALLSRQDMTGTLSELEALDRSSYPDGSAAWFQIRSAAWLDGALCVIGDRSLFVLDGALGLQNSFLDLGDILGAVPSPQGLLLLLYEYDGEDYDTVKRLTGPEASGLETLFRCRADADGLDLYGIGCGREGELLLATREEIGKAAPPDGMGEALFSFYEAGVTNKWAGASILPWAGGFLIACGGEELVCLKYGPLPEKTPLTMWVNGGDFGLLDPYLERYNLSDAPYTVRYSYIEAEEAAFELAAGRGPDLYAFGGSGFLGYSDSAIFEELSSSMAASGRSRADFLSSLIDAVNPGEEMYSVPLGFVLAQFYQNTALQPDPSAPFSDAYELPQVRAEQARIFPANSYTGVLDLFPEGFTRDSLFDWLATVYMGAHLDERNGTCDFHRQEYIALLESCAAFRESNASEDAPSVYRYLNLDYISTAGVYRQSFGDDYSLLNAMGSAYSLSAALAVSNGSAHKDGAWDFIDYCLSSPLGGQQKQISAVSATLEAQLELLASGKMAYAENVTAGDAAKFRELLENTHAVVGRNPELLTILEEEADRYFAGNCTAEEAAASTQGRAALYMAERFQ